MSSTTSAAIRNTLSAIKVPPRRSSDRGHGDHGWLHTYHSFSLARVHPDFDKLGSLRVINEDRVDASQGFGKHSHSEYEIWSYIVAGELEHRDSLGNLEILKRGEIQMTSTGTGISHSEFNRNSEKECFWVQIWARPHTSGLKPSYYTRTFTDAEKLNKLVKVVAPVGTEGVIDERETGGPAPVHSLVTMHASILESKETIKFTLGEKTTKAYIHNIMTSGYRPPTQAASDKFEDGGAKISINGGTILEEGDGAFLEIASDGSRALEVKNVGERNSEWLLWEMEE